MLQQSLGCQMLLALCTEYGTCWRTSAVGITWDFHVRAKRAFEATSPFFHSFLPISNHGARFFRRRSFSGYFN